jgi:Zn-finger nucleic acid-binding protein
MRLLVACPECQRQYDASRRRVGSRFRCHCGAFVEVRQPQGHDARVVRCSSCGAPRQEGSRSCPFCHSDFTLHERDLDTVCPQCLARVSDRARFCHHCGVGLVPEFDAGVETEFCCPACPKGHCLTSRRLGAAQVTVMECGACGGFWLGQEAFRQLAERAKKQAVPPLSVVGPARPVAGIDTPQVPRRGSFYRPCVVCGQLMNRVNYGHTSGVIVDFCKDHGVWFDADQLARLLAWLRAGGKPGHDRQRHPEALPGHNGGRRGAAIDDQPHPADQSRLQSVLDFLNHLFGGSFP